MPQKPVELLCISTMRAGRILFPEKGFGLFGIGTTETEVVGWYILELGGSGIVQRPLKTGVFEVGSALDYVPGWVLVGSSVDLNKLGRMIRYEQVILEKAHIYTLVRTGVSVTGM